MKTHEFLRLIQEIGVILKLDSPTISLVISTYKKFIAANIRQFKQEIVITACFYLVGKIVEDQKRIRDILVVISVVTQMYKIANRKRQDQDPDPILYLPIEVDYNVEQLVPNMKNEMYQHWKKDVLEAEQHLLRIINYDIKNDILEQYAMLLNYLKIFHLEQPLRQMALDIYQDTYFVDFSENISATTQIKGSIYLAINLHRAFCAEREIQHRIPAEYCSPEWWEDFLQVSHQQLLQFEVEMCQYYKSNGLK